MKNSCNEMFKITENYAQIKIINQMIYNIIVYLNIKLTSTCDLTLAIHDKSLNIYLLLKI